MPGTHGRPTATVVVKLAWAATLTAVALSASSIKVEFSNVVEQAPSQDHLVHGAVEAPGARKTNPRIYVTYVVITKGV